MIRICQWGKKCKQRFAYKSVYISFLLNRVINSRVLSLLGIFCQGLKPPTAHQLTTPGKNHNIPQCSLFVTPKFCISTVFSFSWKLKLAPKETENNAYAKFLWFSGRPWSNIGQYWSSTPRCFLVTGTPDFSSRHTCARLCTRGVCTSSIKMARKRLERRKARCDVTTT